MKGWGMTVSWTRGGEKRNLVLFLFPPFTVTMNGIIIKSLASCVSRSRSLSYENKIISTYFTRIKGSLGRCTATKRFSMQPHCDSERCPVSSWASKARDRTAQQIELDFCETAPPPAPPPLPTFGNLWLCGLCLIPTCELSISAYCTGDFTA